jgi:CBS domain-containing protein
VSDLLNPDVVCLRPETPVAEAEQLFARSGVGTAPVVDAQGSVVGVISHSDLVRHDAQRVSVEEAGHFYTDECDYGDLATLRSDRSRTPVEKLMRRRVWTVGRDAGVAVAANVMRERRVHRLFVTERGRLVGMVTALDLLRVVEESG